MTTNVLGNIVTAHRQNSVGRKQTAVVFAPFKRRFTVFKGSRPTCRPSFFRFIARSVSVLVWAKHRRLFAAANLLTWHVAIDAFGLFASQLDRKSGRRMDGFTYRQEMRRFAPGYSSAH